MSSIKLIIKEKNFKVDKKNKRVICTLSVSVNDDSFKPVYLKYKDFRYDNRVIDPFNFTAKGVAICSKDDSFDESIGKKVAANKARLEAYSIFRCLFVNWERDLEVAKKDLEEAKKNLEKFITREKSRLKELFKEEIVESKEDTEENGK